MSRWRLFFACLLWLGANLASSSAAYAQTDSNGLGLSVDIIPLLGDASIQRNAFCEILIRVHNSSEAAFEGQIVAFGAEQNWNDELRGRVTAPLHVATATSVSVRLPLLVGQADNVQVQVRDRRGVTMFKTSIRVDTSNRTLLLNVTRSPALAAHLDAMPVPSGYEPWSGNSRYGATPTSARVVNAQYDSISGAPLLPRRAAGYARVAAVLLRSDDFIRLGAQEQEALSGFLLGGGTLALVMVRPEDLRHRRVVALTGGILRRGAAAPALLASLTLHPVSFGGGARRPSSTPVTTPPLAPAAPRADVADSLHGYSGGNLMPSSYGASAVYGLGEVHLLGFEPNVAPANDDPWVHIRLVDMLRRANERTSGAVIRHGEPSSRHDTIQEQLDPNQGARWAIAVATLLLIAYSILAGPGSYSHYRKKNKPLRAIFTLPLLSFGAFVLVFLLGLAAKGVTGRARHLTLVDAGAGMSLGVARRYRVLFVPTARTLSIRASSTSSILIAAPQSYQLSSTDTIVVDQQGPRLNEVSLNPWQAYLVREDDYASLGGGIAIVKNDAGEPLVINRTGQEMQGVVLVHGGVSYFLKELSDGKRAHLADFRLLKKSGAGSLDHWASGMPFHSFMPHRLDDEFTEVDSKLAISWQALSHATDDDRDWFPAGVPVVLAQLKGGEGVKRDSGLPVDQQRLLLRVVGWGGER